MELSVIDHPLVATRLTVLRDARTSSAGFRAALRDLALMLVYEAGRDTPTEPVPIRTPLAPMSGTRLAAEPLLVVVLRAALGMLDGAHSVYPNSEVAFVGVARNDTTHEPAVYLESVPEDLSGTPIVVLDPMLATGGSMRHTLGLLHRRGATDITVICAIAAPQGLAALGRMSPSPRVVTAAVDDGLDEAAYIVPGVGDAGDRQFGQLRFNHD